MHNLIFKNISKFSEKTLKSQFFKLLLERKIQVFCKNSKKLQTVTNE